MSRLPSESVRDLGEVIVGFGVIMAAIWSPDSARLALAPIAFVITLGLALAGRRRAADASSIDASPADALLRRENSFDSLGLGLRGLFSSLWILPAAFALAVVSALVAQRIGTLHPLYKGDLKHISGYVLWTTYQQFLLQIYFMPRLRRLGASEPAAVAITAVLFAVAHLPNLPLTAATLVWGAASALLFLRYRNLYALGLAQGLLGLCFAICVPDAMHHHLRVGLGYLRYQAVQRVGK